MRKWMRDKLKRGKKSQEGAEQPAPLQPAYFNAESQESGTQPATEEPAQQARVNREEAPIVGAVDPKPGLEVAQPGSAPEQEAGPRPRRRRGRGGRGRRHASQPPAAGVAGLPPSESSAPVTTAPPAPMPSPPLQASKGRVVLAIGLPGSGKSSWFKRHNISPLSSDLVRALLFDDPAEQRFQDLVFSNLRSMLRARLIARRPLSYVDATNLTAHDRHSWIKLASDYGYEVQAVYFDVPLEVCMERNRRRQRVVSDEIMRKMAAKLKPPTFEEGFSKITVVKVKIKE